MESAAEARATPDLCLSGITRFIMRWTLSPGCTDGRGPPSSFLTGVRHAQNGTRIFAAKNILSQATNRSRRLLSLVALLVAPLVPFRDIEFTPVETGIA